MTVCSYLLILPVVAGKTIKVMRFSIFVSFLRPKHNVFLSSSGPGLGQVRVRKVRVRNYQGWLKFQGTTYEKHFSQSSTQSSKLKIHSKFK